jgi:hypothetical protein
MANVNEVLSILNRDTSSGLNYSPFSQALSNFARTSSTPANSTTSAFRVTATGTVGSGAKSNTTNENFLVRNHYS